MKLHLKTLVTCAVLAGLSLPALAVDNLLVDPGFEGPEYWGQGWGTWGAIDFNNFWGADIHASMYADWYDCIGGVFQPGLSGEPGVSYQFVLYNTRIEPNWKADLRFGLEYYASDEATKLGETIVLIDTAARTANGQVDGNVMTMQGTAVPGTVFVRPAFSFGNVDPTYEGKTQANSFVFDTFMSLAPAAGDQFLKNPGFEDLNANAAFGDYWGHWGNTSFNAYFGPANGHATLWADTIGNSGGVYQQGILGTPGSRYQFALADVRIEQNWDADLYFGLEYFGGDDFHKVGETVMLADTSQPGDGLQFSMTGTAAAGTVYVRPFLRFDNVGSSGGTLRNAFVFAAGLTQLPPGLRGDLNCDGSADFGDINPFVLYLSNYASWQTTYAGCPASNGDINEDGTYPSFGDINPFVTLLSSGGG
jgi:hypothetical protein